MKKNKKIRKIKIRLFEEGTGGVNIKEVMGVLRTRGFFVEKIEEERRHLEITVNPKKKEEVEKILEKYGCFRMPSEPQKPLSNF